MLNKPHYKITLIYTLISSLWIFFSDRFILLTFKSSDFITRFQTYKGLFFVLFTGGIIFFLIRAYYIKENEQNKKIALLAESKKNFLKNISHELKTPLNGIILINELLADNGSFNKHELTSELHHCASELDDLISNIIAVSELQSQNIAIEEETFNISDFTWEIGMLYYLSARKKGIDLGIYIDPEIPSLIISDKKKLKRIIVNLLENAIKFTSSGYILFELIKGSDNDSLLFKVTDTGSGFNSSEDIFNSFFSKQYSSDKSFAGIGAGLIIAKQHSDILGGKLWFESFLNKGSIFYFEIKVKKLSDDNYIGTDINFQQKKIIVISDFSANNIVLKKVLEYYNCSAFFYSLNFDINSLQSFNYTFIVDSNVSYTLLNSIKDFLSKDKYSNLILIKEYFDKESQTDSLVLPFKINNIVNSILKKNFFNKVTALVADDNELNREVISSILEKELTEVYTANNGTKALELWNLYKPSLIFLDINLPNINGYEIAKKIRNQESGKRSRIIAVTAYNINESKLREHGFDQYIEKPFKFDEIYNIVLQQLKLKELK